MAKLFENCYRIVNITYVNEIGNACVLQGIDPQEIITPAATKGLRYQELRRGLGVKATVNLSIHSVFLQTTMSLFFNGLRIKYGLGLRNLQLLSTKLWYLPAIFFLNVQRPLWWVSDSDLGICIVALARTHLLGRSQALIGEKLTFDDSIV